MMEELDEYACIKAYDKAKARKQEFIRQQKCLMQLNKNVSINVSVAH